MHQLRGHRPNRLSINRGDVLTECRQRWAPPICVSINMGGVFFNRAQLALGTAQLFVNKYGAGIF